MAIKVRPNIVTNSLALYLDAANTKSYPRSGTTWNDLSGNRNNGTLVNGPVFSGANGGCIVFDGVDDNTTTTYSNPGGNNTTQIIWYKWNGVLQAKVLSYLGNSSNAGFGFYINNGANSGATGDKVSVLYGGAFYNALDTGTTFGTLVSNVYTQLVLTRDTLTTRLYQNAVLLGSTTRTPNNNNNSLSFSLGDAVVAAAGSYSIVEFYNRCLTDAEIQQNYNATKTRFGLT